MKSSARKALRELMVNVKQKKIIRKILLLLSGSCLVLNLRFDNIFTAYLIPLRAENLNNGRPDYLLPAFENLVD